MDVFRRLWTVATGLAWALIVVGAALAYGLLGIVGFCAWCLGAAAAMSASDGFDLELDEGDRLASPRDGHPPASGDGRSRGPGRREPSASHLLASLTRVALTTPSTMRIAALPTT